MRLLKIKVIEEMRLRGERRTGLMEAFQEGNQKRVLCRDTSNHETKKKTGKEWPEGPGNRENDKTQEENAVNISFCPLQSLQSSWGSKG